MADMNAPGRIGEHLQHVIFRPRVVITGGEDRLFVPPALPARLGFACVVAFGGHGILRTFRGFKGRSKGRRTRPQKTATGQRPSLPKVDAKPLNPPSPSPPRSPPPSP